MTRTDWMASGMAALILVGATSPVALAQAPESGSARGIFLAGSALGVSTEIEIERGNQRGMVPPTYEFRSGDKFWIHVTSNRAAYIYVLNRTIVGSPETAASRGIKLMQKEDAKTPAPDAYTMVYPAPNGKPTRVAANVATRIPTNPSQFFTMDEVLGAEKLMVVAAEQPSDIARLFDATTGKLARAGNTTDSASGVLNRLNGDLVRAADNSMTEEPPRSRDIRIRPLPGAPAPAVASSKPPEVPPQVGTNDPRVAAGSGLPKPSAPPSDTTTVVRRGGEPLLQELTLVHLARQ